MLDVSNVINLDTSGVVFGRILLHHKFVLDFYICNIMFALLFILFVFKIVAFKVVP